MLSGKWMRGITTNNLEIERYSIERCDPLTLECLMIEMRKKYAHSAAIQYPVAQAPDPV